MKLSMLAHPPNPNPTTNTQTTTNTFKEYNPTQPPNFADGLSTAFCQQEVEKIKRLAHNKNLASESMKNTIYIQLE